MRPHNDQVAPEFVEYFEDVSGAGPVGHDHLMVDSNLGVRRLNAVKPLPQVSRIRLARIGQQFATLGHHSRWLGDVEEDHLRSNGTG